MTRVDDDTLAVHLEVALSVATPSLFQGLGSDDRRQRQAIGEIVRQLVERLRCFDIRCESGTPAFHHPALFPQDLGPIG